MTERTAKLARLDGRALISVSGAGWRDFLQGLVTQDVSTLEGGGLRYGALLAPQGRLLFELFLHGRGEGVLIEVAADRRDDLLARLKLYRLRAKVELEAVEGGVFALWDGPGAPGWAPDPRLAELGFRAAGEAPPAPGAISVDADAYDAHRLALGVYDELRDGGTDKLYPIELNFDLLSGIDFKKGCFVGQETTSRMKRRAAVKSRAVPLKIDGAIPTTGAEVLAGQLRAGEVLSARPGLALALMRLDRAAGAELRIDGRQAVLAAPEWLTDSL